MKNVFLVCVLASILFLACSQKTISQTQQNGSYNNDYQDNTHINQPQNNTTTKPRRKAVIIRSNQNAPRQNTATPTRILQPKRNAYPQANTVKPTPTARKNRIRTINRPNNNIVRMGAERTEVYLPLLQNKRVALVVNQTSTIGDTHIADALLHQGVQVVKVFAPEHGFRGKADAGEKVSNSRDVKTGLPIVSLYGKNKKPNAEMLAGIDAVIFDIQDVGARFYTYISTMHYVMEACAENNIEVLVFDRPNPNGHFVDGPVLDLAYQSFVGMHKIPIVHGMTVGELAKMINGEGWLANGLRCRLTVIPCEGYDHETFYELPIKPSPNLPNSHSIYLYPSLCLFEGTAISVGRGTDQQFQVIGDPKLYGYPFRFTPVSKSGAKYPKHENKTCYGQDLSTLSLEALRAERQFNLSYLLDIYKAYPDKATFFNKNNFFDKLAGNATLQNQIKSGMTESQIRDSWRYELDYFKYKRKNYLLYPDFGSDNY